MAKGDEFVNINFMPEGPEVQTIVNDLAHLIVNKRIADFLFDPKARGIVENATKPYLKKSVSGQTVIDVARKGKYIIIRLSNGFNLILHLRMTGQLLTGLNEEIPRYHRATIIFNDGLKLYLADRSTWVKIIILSDNDFVKYEKFEKLGMDALSNKFTSKGFTELLQKNSKIHSLLLNQHFISGLGNIYVNEALFMAKIHPLRKANSLNKVEVAKLYRAIKSVTSKALKYKGTTFSDYRTPAGSKGEYQRYLKVFKRSGRRCFICGSIISRGKSGGRSIFFCPSEQK